MPRSKLPLSSKHQVVIPPEIRRAFKLVPGQKLEVVVHEGRITLVLLAGAVEATAQLIVPTLVMTEVARRLDAQGRRRVIPQVVAHMRLGRIVPLDETLALAAATIGRHHTLALADSIVYATALECGAVVWTQDADFKPLERVEYRQHARRRFVASPQIENARAPSR